MKDDRVYLLHVRDAIDRILDYTSEGREAFFADSKTQDAVVRNLEIIGEVAKNLSPDLKGRHPGLPWRESAGMRDKMIHLYFGVDLALVWNVVERELPNLRRGAEELLKELDGRP